MERVSARAREVSGSCEEEIATFIARGRRDGLAASTLSTRGYVLRSFVTDLGASRPSQITRAAIDRWFAARRETSERTAADYLATAQLWLKWLHGEGRIALNPAAMVKRPKVVMRCRRAFLMPDQARALLDACEDEGLKFALLCALHAGLRKNEIIEARPGWFDLDAGLLHVQATETFQPKTRDNRTVPLTKEFRAWLTDVYGLREPFMLRPEARHRNWRYRFDFKKAYQALVKRCGLAITFHDLRRTFASLHVSRGTSIYKVAKWLGDTVEVVEETYGHLIPQDAQIDAAWE